MEKIVIYGGGNTGKSAYYYFKGQNKYECLFFVDNDKSKQGTLFEGLEMKSPDVLRELKGVKVIIASIFWREILQEVENITGLDVAIYGPAIEDHVSPAVKEELDNRTINLGSFLKAQGEIKCKELVFVPGGSQILDYVFLKALAEKYHCKKYLEIGTYIGESINILSDCCDKLYSITAPKEGSPFSADSWCRDLNLPNYSERLAYSDKISHYYTDSKIFDFSKIEENIDLYFIDGYHSYLGVYTDTKNIFQTRSKDSIIVWHDFRKGGFAYVNETITAVKDALGEQFKNVYVTNGNYCGVYLPDMYIEDFEICGGIKYEKNAKLYTYDISLGNCHIK